MLCKIDNKLMGSSDLGWLQSKYHFSFANYYNPENINFGMLRVVNDDVVAANSGFDTHPHNDMEIITYVIDGHLTHNDSIGNSKRLSRGDIQYMSAGRGITHSEHNMDKEPLRLLQIWIYPQMRGLTPIYGDVKIEANERENKLLQIVSGATGQGIIKINQDANIFVSELDEGRELKFRIGEDRQAYIIQIEGISSYNNLTLEEQDGLEVTNENIEIVAKSKSHIMIIELDKPDN